MGVQGLFNVSGGLGNGGCGTVAAVEYQDPALQIDIPLALKFVMVWASSMFFGTLTC